MLNYPIEYEIKSVVVGARTFKVPYGKRHLYCIVDEREKWEHISVSLSTPNRCPTWGEMDYVKNVFWGPEVYVMQLHVPKKRNINIHRYCLHLWRPVNELIPIPVV